MTATYDAINRAGRALLDATGPALAALYVTDSTGEPLYDGQATMHILAVAALDLVRAVDAAPEDEQPDGWRTDGHPLGDGQVHVYHSTACLHGQHAHCGSRFNAYTGEPKKPATCKFCDATCICACHHKEES